MPVPVTALYAALLTLVSVALQILVGRERLRTGVSIYDGGDPALAVAIRRHANFAEHVPLALVLLAVIELNGASATWLHVLGAALLASRVIHPIGLHYEIAQKPARAVGAVGTLLVTLAATATAAWQGLGGA